MASDCWSMDVCNQSAGVSMNAPFEANWRMEDIFHLISAGIITSLDTKMVSGTSTCVCFLYLPMDSGSGPAATLARCIRHHVVPDINASHISNVCWIASPNDDGRGKWHGGRNCRNDGEDRCLRTSWNWVSTRSLPACWRLPTRISAVAFPAFLYRFYV